MKIYTKSGDKGTSSLLGGTRVAKYHDRLECYGTIDELNSHIGVVRDLCNNNAVCEILAHIQHTLFTIGSYLANEKPHERTTPILSTQHIELLEKTIDTYTEELPKLTHFILPAGDIVSSHTHVCRTVCRRAERLIVKLSESTHIEENVIIYMNRLSDFLFVLARKFLKDVNKQEITWNPLL
ncbi:MAG TPA: cob(I)yrinic acid a,c-diamide adenosyltransferase [Bacteroidales bacterium]|jgi:cob(I)alamin adenosyltransferase|nr:cob(I)yrinic acid a,c-diamide adenosyltransferase [Bacteroidales bacterium]HRS17859.1 cob(I)yrinic acid a,c-diamide adenosyltransferase [Bacteroidales bacterium]